jgi:hypothetical protein
MGYQANPAKTDFLNAFALDGIDKRNGLNPANENVEFITC